MLKRIEFYAKCGAKIRKIGEITNKLEEKCQYSTENMYVSNINDNYMWLFLTRIIMNFT